MILINLLPHREARRQARKRAFYTALGLSAVIGIGVLILWYGAVEQLIARQDARNNYLKQEIAKLDVKIKDIADLKADIEALKARQGAVESLQTDRNVPVYLLNELVKQTPDGVYLTTIKQIGSVVTLTGKAQTNDRVSEFLRNTAYSSPWLERPELVEIKSAAVSQRDQNASRLFDFTMKVYIKQPETPAAEASAPGKTGRPNAKAMAS